MSEIRVSVLNEGTFGGLATTPVWFGFHDNSFDLFEGGEPASLGLERIAEDGTFADIAAELIAADADGQGGIITGGAGPIVAGEFTSVTLDVDSNSNPYLSLAAMILPSNDAFIGNGQAILLFDENGEFLGRQILEFDGEDVYDAGTEVNTELDAAFINQTAPDTGVDENGVVRLHDGFNGSEANPEGEGDQIILGGTNAFGQPIIPEFADFTQEGFEVANIYVNTVSRADFSEAAEAVTYFGDGDDDLVILSANDDVAFGFSGNDDISGGDGNDLIRGGNGIDLLNGDAGDDAVFGGNGNDQLFGGDDDDLVSGGGGNDRVDGGAGSDFISGNEGDDTLIISGGDDLAVGGAGDDLFIVQAGGDSIIRDFLDDDGDRLLIDLDGIESFADLQAVGTDTGSGATFDFADAGSLLLRGVDLGELTGSNVVVA